MQPKPINSKNYGSIPHLTGSRTGYMDRTCHPGQVAICTEKARDKHDTIYVQEKLDGANVGCIRLNGAIVPVTRRGWPAASSSFVQHNLFAEWVNWNQDRFFDVLNEGERLVGEWLILAHGTRYDLKHEPFVAFDIMRGQERLPVRDFIPRVACGCFATPTLLHFGDPISIQYAMDILGTYGHHGAIDPVEGAVWRVERDYTKNGIVTRKVDFLAKYVKPGKVDGRYLKCEEPVWNKWPETDGYQIDTNRKPLMNERVVR